MHTSPRIVLVLLVFRLDIVVVKTVGCTMQTGRKVANVSVGEHEAI